jgi:hypothetical protein
MGSGIEYVLRCDRKNAESLSADYADYADYAGEDCRIEERGLCCSERERSDEQKTLPFASSESVTICDNLWKILCGSFRGSRSKMKMFIRRLRRLRGIPD